MIPFECVRCAYDDLSGLDLVPESGALTLRRHDGRETVVPGLCV